MDIKPVKDIVIIGSGNIVTSLAVALYTKQYNILQVYSRTLEHAEQLAGRVGAGFTNNPAFLSQQADLYIISVSDAEIENVLKTLTFNKSSVVVHTSGSTSIDVLKKYVPKCGVLYPLQTFSKVKIISDFKSIPVFIEASDDAVLLSLKGLLCKLTDNVRIIDSKQRLALHVSAVFACNFINYLLVQATGICNENALEKEWLKPLIYETIEKALSVDDPASVQTGPAARHDKLILEKHIEFLSDYPDKLQVYRLLSEMIMNLKSKNN